MRTKKTNYIHQTQIKQIELSDLDLELEDFVFGANPERHVVDGIFVERKPNFSYSDENDCVEIDKVIKALEELKNAGATHVDITPHCDHRSYYFYGSVFRKATDEEIKKHTKKNIESKKLVLEVEYQKAKETVENYEKELKKLNECD